MKIPPYIYLKTKNDRANIQVSELNTTVKRKYYVPVAIPNTTIAIL